jgi:hypothetical protein
VPVVTTPVLDLKPTPPHLAFATDAASMQAAVASVLDSRADAAACRALARPHDWSALADRMVQEMERRLAAVS